MTRPALGLAVVALVATPQAPVHSTGFEGPYDATVERVIDGDTFVANVEIWPNINASVSFRIRGIEAPEMLGAGCPEEREEALRARDVLLEELFERNEGGTIELENVEADVWSGRIVADVYRPNTDRRTSLVGQLLNRRTVVEWEPGMSDIPWCLLLTTSPTD